MKTTIIVVLTIFKIISVPTKIELESSNVSCKEWLRWISDGFGITDVHCRVMDFQGIIGICGLMKVRFGRDYAICNF